jgi:pyruvate/2-oxoglutarate dehydrogenase complex dihydrolipoamide dehydrogenase (E3) component
MEGTELLVATGRRARTTGMMFDRAGALREGTWIDVDDLMCVSSVSEGWLYAVGDPNGRALMTHIAKYQAKLAGNLIVAKAKGIYQTEVAAREWDKLTAQPKGLKMAQTVFTDP